MKSVGIGLLMLVLVASGAWAGVTTNVLDAEVRVAGEAALRWGVAWLERQQAKDGVLGGAEYSAAVTGSQGVSP